MTDALFAVTETQFSVFIVGMLVVFLLVALVPLIAILAAHQRKMAELFRSQMQQPDQLAREQEMANQMAALTQIVSQQTIALDDIKQLQMKALGSTEVQERIGREIR